jgi:hypothetical protein
MLNMRLQNAHFMIVLVRLPGFVLKKFDESRAFCASDSGARSFANSPRFKLPAFKRTEGPRIAQLAAYSWVIFLSRGCLLSKRA